MIQGELVTTTELARSCGVSRSTAFRWIKAAEKKFGPSLVARVGRRYRMHPSVLSALGEAAAAPSVEAPLGSLADVARRLDVLEQRLNRLERIVLMRGRSA